MITKISEASVALLEEELERAHTFNEKSENPFVSNTIVNENGIGVSEDELSAEMDKRINSVEEVPYMEYTVEEPTIEIETKSVKSQEELFEEYIQILNNMAQILNKEVYLGIENENIHDISYQLDESEINNFIDLKNRLDEINQQDPSIRDIYANNVDRLRIIRENMASILNTQPYPGIENSNIHDISYQLDDNEKDRFNQLNQELQAIKQNYPALFNNVVSKEVESAPQVEEQVVDDNPQHIANPETGYAVGGFQAPAIVPVQEASLDDNPQHAPNYETGYAVGGFQAPAVVEEQKEEQVQGPTEEEIKKQKRKDLLKKSLIASAGFVTGVGLSCVPGVGTIRMGISAVKLTGTAVNVWANKHPNGKVAQVRDAAVVFAENRFPNITNGVRKINAKMKQTPVNIFINGMAAGYLAGNIFEMVTGNTVLEAVKGQFDKVPDAPVVDNTVTNTTPTEPNVGDTVPDNTITDSAAEVIQDTASTFDPSAATEAIKGGATIDLSGLPQGLVSSDAAQGVNLITQAGKDVSFLREVTLNDGTVMWAFNQSNGLGYAWFKAEDVLNELARTGQDLASVAGRSL